MGIGRVEEWSGQAQRVSPTVTRKEESNFGTAFHEAEQFCRSLSCSDSDLGERVMDESKQRVSVRERADDRSDTRLTTRDKLGEGFVETDPREEMRRRPKVHDENIQVSDEAVEEIEHEIGQDPIADNSHVVETEVSTKPNLNAPAVSPLGQGGEQVLEGVLASQALGDWQGDLSEVQSLLQSNVMPTGDNELEGGLLNVARQDLGAKPNTILAADSMTVAVASTTLEGLKLTKSDFAISKGEAAKVVTQDMLNKPVLSLSSSQGQQSAMNLAEAQIDSFLQQNEQMGDTGNLNFQSSAFRNALAEQSAEVAAAEEAQVSSVMLEGKELMGKLDATQAQMKLKPSSDGVFRGQMSLNRFAPELTEAIDQGARRMQLRLDPPSLGGLDVDLLVNKGQVSIQIRTDSSLSAAQIQEQTHDLREALREAGLELQNFDVGQGRSGNGEGQDENAGQEEDVSAVVDTRAQISSTAKRHISRGRVDLIV
jgi:flagellar hook-length control protein FliK